MPDRYGPVTLGYRWDSGLLEAVYAGSSSTAFAYDSLGQVLLAATVSDVSGDTLPRQGFTYDRLGRLIGLSERVQSDTVTYAYGYDPAGRLAEVRTGAVVTPSQTVTAAYDAQDRLLSAGSATYVHVETGERTLKIVGPDTTRTRYDAYGNLRDVYLPTGTHVQYVVDAQQRRTARLVNGVITNRWLYQSQLAIAAEVDSAGTPIRTFTYGTHGNVPDLMTLANGRQYRLITDHLGSVRLVIDVSADTVLQRLAYDAYGRVVVDTKPGFQPFGYAGGLYDPLTGLVRFGARDYDAEAGRWTAKDPVAIAGGSANLYEYAAGTPTDLSDPEGLRPGTTGGIPNWVIDLAAGFGDGASGGLTLLIRELIDANGSVDFCSSDYFTGALAGTISAFIVYRVGGELRIGRNFRFAPYGNRTGHEYGRFPHYHRRGAPSPVTGIPSAGGGLNRHRPWQPPAPNQPWWTRF